MAGGEIAGKADPKTGAVKPQTAVIRGDHPDREPQAHAPARSSRVRQDRRRYPHLWLVAVPALPQDVPLQASDRNSRSISRTLHDEQVIRPGWWSSRLPAGLLPCASPARWSNLTPGQASSRNRRPFELIVPRFDLAITPRRSPAQPFECGAGAEVSDARKWSRPGRRVEHEVSAALPFKADRLICRDLTSLTTASHGEALIKQTGPHPRSGDKGRSFVSGFRRFAGCWISPVMVT